MKPRFGHSTDLITYLSLNSSNSKWSKSLNLPGGDGEGVISIIRF